MKRPLNALSAVLLVLPAIAQVAIRWDAETSRPAQLDIPVMRGETVLIEPRMVQYGDALDLAGSSASLWIQTNGMGSAWWQAPAAVSITETGRVSAAFAPSNDVGASAYTWFIGVTHTNSSLSYRASGRLVIRASPGAVPNAIPLPVQLIDFSTVTPLNAPWLLSSFWISGSNALAAALQAASTNLSARIDAVSSSVSNLSDSVSLSVFDLSNSVAAAYSFALTNQVKIIWDSDAPGIWWEVRGGTNVTTKSRTVSGTNFTVTLSADFEETVTHTRPTWTNNVWPFVDGIFEGMQTEGLATITTPGGALWNAFLPEPAAYPFDLTVFTVESHGSATVSISSYIYTTNIISSCNLVTGNVWQAVATVSQEANDAWEKAGDAQSDINGHAPAGTISAPHLLLGDRAMIDAVPGKVNANGGTLTNGYIAGTLTFKNTQPTNLVGRMFASNDVLFVEWINQ